MNPWSSSKRAVRKSLSVLACAVFPWLLHCGPFLRWFNRTYEGTGKTAAHRIWVLLRRMRIRSSLVWTWFFSGRSVRIPVEPYFERSWKDALSFKIMPQGIRRFYDMTAQRLPEGVFFDVGANTGTHSYPLAAAGLHCVLFEPQQQCRDYIQAVIDLNGCSDVRIEPCVVSDQDGQEIKLFISANSHCSSLEKDNAQRFGVKDSFKVRAVSLDKYCQREGIVPSVIKVDVEGHEWPVLYGAKACLHAHHPSVIIESWPGSKDRAKIWMFFREMGYSCYNEDGWPVRTQNHFCEDPAQNFVFISHAQTAAEYESMIRKERGSS